MGRKRTEQKLHLKGRQNPTRSAGRLQTRSQNYRLVRPQKLRAWRRYDFRRGRECFPGYRKAGDQGVFDQIARYNLSFQVPYLTVTNGHEHYACYVDLEKSELRFLEEIPEFEEWIEGRNSNSNSNSNSK